MLTALLVDDEEPARALLAELLQEVGGVRVVGEAESGDEALPLIRRLAPAVVFLDVQMPGRDGLSVAQELVRDPAPPLVVFVTAFDAFAVQAFELQAVDYLLKPVDPQRLRQAVERLQRVAASAPSRQDDLSRLVRMLETRLDRLALLDEKSGVRHVVDLSEVAWFTSEDEKTYARVGPRLLRCMEPLSALEARLPRDRFMRTHRSFIVNLGHVREVVPWASGAYNLKLKNGDREIPLSRNFAAEFKTRTGWL